MLNPARWRTPSAQAVFRSQPPSRPDRGGCPSCHVLRSAADSGTRTGDLPIRCLRQARSRRAGVSVKAVVAEPHFPQANLQFCQSIHGKPWTPPWLNPAGTDLVLPFSHEITLECREASVQSGVESKLLHDIGYVSNLTRRQTVADSSSRL
jgi:hypothetical protein